MADLLTFALGLTALVAGASALVRGASKLALSLGLSPLVVGLTIVAFGTSAPELAVSAGAVLDGNTDMALGNVVGSNVFNVLFILGVSALITESVMIAIRPGHENSSNYLDIKILWFNLNPWKKEPTFD